MNRALLYLWFALLKRRLWHFGRSLRRPAALVGFVGVLVLVAFVFYFRQHEVVGKIVQPKNLLAGALIMLCGSLFKGLLQRGLAFEPPDIEFVFTSPFTQRQIVFYRLLPSYLFSVIQGLVFLALFASHFTHPVLAAAGLTLFQILCFHVATMAAIYSGSLPEERHYRLRWMLVGAYGLLTVLYLRFAWNVRLTPAWAHSSLVSLLFYPAVNLPDAALEPGLHRWALHWAGGGSGSLATLGRPALYLCSLAGLAAGSLWWLLRLKLNVFEAALGTTQATAARRQRVKQGLSLAGAGAGRRCSAELPQLPFFRGVGAIVWKNLVVARRSGRELLLAGAFALVYNGFLIGLLWVYHDLLRKYRGEPPLYELLGFHIGVALALAVQGFFLQRMFPFDFRRDGHYLVSFRTLPVAPLALALAEVTVPTVFCLGAQVLSIGALLYYAHFPWLLGLAVVLAYPAIALGLNGVWNVHYLLAASRRAGGQGESTSAVGMMMVVALSFLIFFPAGWVALHAGKYFSGPSVFSMAAGSSVAVQYAVDVLVLLLLAKLFERFEVARDS